MAVIGGIGVISFHQPVRSVLSLVVVMLALSVLFLLLSAQFIFAVQIIVYAGAVMVLFLFVITLLGPARGETSPHQNEHASHRRLAARRIVVPAARRDSVRSRRGRRPGPAQPTGDPDLDRAHAQRRKPDTGDVLAPADEHRGPAVRP